ncbi:MAG: TonB-dependent receptor [Bacteroidales bacterium]|nr:TonB-dependent receptor [Bacteroidales bacterium]
MKKNFGRFVLTIYLLTLAVVSHAQVLKGTVIDAATGEALIGASIQLKGTASGTITDIDGRFELKDLKEGNQKLVISYIFYRTAEIDLEVKAENPELNIGLELDGQQLSEVTVIGRKNLESVAALQMERQMSTAAIENIGAREMAGKGISNVEEGVKKITGVSVASAGQLIVRGLGDRYSITTLNGLPIASPNPDNKLVPLNLFPSSTVQNITVSKVYNAETYADYSGAHIDIATKVNIPEDFLEISLNTGGSVNTIFRNRYQMDRGGSLFRTSRLESQVLDMPLVDFDEYVKSNDIFNSSFAVKRKTALPSLGGTLSMGKNFNVGGQTLSILISANLSNDDQNVSEAFQRTLEATGNIQSDFTYDSYSQTLKTSALGYVGYTLRESDRIGYTFFYARNADDTYQLRNGEDAEGHLLTGSNNVTHVYSLQNHQLNGLHFMLDSKIEMDWAASYGRTGSYEPDRRQVMYIREDGALKLFKLNRQETMRYFGSLDEDELNADIGLKWKWGDNNHLKAGISYKDKGREYMGTRFYYNLNRLDPEITDVFDTDSFLNQGNVGSGNIVIERKKQPKDSYRAGTDIIAGYMTADLYPTENLLINLGVRYEYARQWVRYASDGGDWFGRMSMIEHGDLFPALNVKYTFNEDNILRFSASRTITRPSFIEMAPFLYQESYGSAQIRGNEDLNNAYNYNLDLRYELFGSDGDMLSVTGYFKYLESPIERIQALNGGATLHSFRNADNGFAAGLEVEFRKRIAKDLNVGANASYMYTNVKLPEGGSYTNKERPLQGASPVLINADITWSPRFGDEKALNMVLLYNMQGSRIHAVGVSQLGDIRQDAVHTLNFNASYQFNRHWSVKLQASDLLGQDIVFRQDVPLTGQTVEVERHRYGQCLEIGVTFKL